MSIEDPTDDELTIRALQMYANWIQTGDPILSAQDAEAQGVKVKPLQVEQMRLVVRLDELATRVQTKPARKKGRKS